MNEKLAGENELCQQNVEWKSKYDLASSSQMLMLDLDISHAIFFFSLSLTQTLSNLKMVNIIGFCYTGTMLINLGISCLPEAHINTNIFKYNYEKCRILCKSFDNNSIIK